MNLKNKVSSEQLLKIKDRIKKIFFWRVCGTGMGASAILLQQAGFEVEGADQKFYPPMGPYLEREGVKTHRCENFDFSYLNQFDLIVVGNVLAGNSEIARKIEELNIPFTSFPTAIGSLVLKNKKVIGISGTHGKTTTTYYGVQILENLGKRPGFLIGGVLEGRSSSFLGEDDFFLIESDEYDSCYFQKESKFHSYFINNLIVTSLEFDHGDIFEDQNAINKEFKRLFENIDGTIVASDDYPEIRKTLESSSLKGEFYFYGGKLFRIIDENESGTVFEIRVHDKLGKLQNYTFETNLIGDHNLNNLSGLLSLFLSLGFDATELNSAIKSLENVKRRQEVRGKFNNTLIIDDFAHHPTAVRETLMSLKKKFRGNNLFCIFEPASATARSSLFSQEFIKALGNADDVCILEPPRKTSLKKQNTIDSKFIANELNGVCASSLEEVINWIGIKSKLESSVIVIFSNGTCMGLWESDFVNQLEKK